MHSKLFVICIFFFFTQTKGNKPGIIKTMLVGNRDPYDNKNVLTHFNTQLMLKTAFTLALCSAVLYLIVCVGVHKATQDRGFEGIQ